MEQYLPGNEGSADKPKPSGGIKRGVNLHRYKSFDYAAEALNAARRSPEERLRETVELILRVYGLTEAKLAARRKKLSLTTIRRG